MAIHFWDAASWEIIEMHEIDVLRGGDRVNWGRGVYLYLV